MVVGTEGGMALKGVSCFGVVLSTELGNTNPLDELVEGRIEVGGLAVVSLELVVAVEVFANAGEPELWLCRKLNGAGLETLGSGSM